MSLRTKIALVLACFGLSECTYEDSYSVVNDTDGWVTVKYRNETDWKTGRKCVTLQEYWPSVSNLSGWSWFPGKAEWSPASTGDIQFVLSGCVTQVRIPPNHAVKIWSSSVQCPKEQRSCPWFAPRELAVKSNEPWISMDNLSHLSFAEYRSSRFHIVRVSGVRSKNSAAP